MKHTINNSKALQKQLKIQKTLQRCKSGSSFLPLRTLAHEPLKAHRGNCNALQSTYSKQYPQQLAHKKDIKDVVFLYIT